ncbi:hypothetical protein ACHAXA_011392 [Cyclostephanos tholiformis]|uniref:Uncharacterized protein n=1 Tax=Cyclostephanos tholiformis TaxID=382380 RepID=A0ABD3RAC1_9STRA
MRCASVLLESSKAIPSSDVVVDDDGKGDGGDVVSEGRVGGGGGDVGDLLTDEMVYDMPRGLTKMPVRRGVGWDGDVDNDANDDDWSSGDYVESRAIMNSDTVRSKMTMSNQNDMYFSIVTKRSS